MKKQHQTFAVALAASGDALPPALAQMIDGQVVKIDEAAGKITIKHGPIKKFDMDEGMTMAWRAQTRRCSSRSRPATKSSSSRTA